ncbi:MAG: hypothetical protein LBO71_09280 [Prevotellaceae bacterium]|jgi:hypothetical protein|nr:hypothetical protein [Prevotellaceae bacterium]
MKKGKLDFLIGVADDVRENVNQSNGKSSVAQNNTPATTFTPAPSPALSPSLSPSPSPSPPPPPQQKQKRELGKKVAVSDEVNVAGIIVTKEMLNNLDKVAEEINGGLCHVRIHPEHDMQLSIMAKKLRYEHRLRGRGGISKMALIYLILDNALKGGNK